MTICVRGRCLALALEPEEFEDIGWKGCICACRCVAGMGWGRLGGKTVSAQVLTVSLDGSGTAKGKRQHTHRPAPPAPPSL